MLFGFNCFGVFCFGKTPGDRRETTGPMRMRSCCRLCRTSKKHRSSPLPPTTQSLVFSVAESPSPSQLPLTTPNHVFSMSESARPYPATQISIASSQAMVKMSSTAFVAVAAKQPSQPDVQHVRSSQPKHLSWPDARRPTNLFYIYSPLGISGRGLR